MTAQLWLYLDAVLMFAGGALILVVGKARTDKEHAHTIYHGIVPMIAASAYFAMAVGQGSVTLSTGRLFYFARYIDWSFTTPLLLLPLCYTAVHSRLRRGDLIAGVMLADLLMIVTAFVFGASEVVWVKWTWFLISCVAFFVVLWAMWLPLMRENASEPALVQQAYKRDAGILTVLWLVYPVILFLDTDGTGIVTSTTGVALIAIIDLLSKPVYGLISLAGMKKIIDGELSGGAGTVVQRRAA